MLLGIDAGSTTCKYTLVDDSGNVLAREYGRHNSKQAEKVLEFLGKLEAEHGLVELQGTLHVADEEDGVVQAGEGNGRHESILTLCKYTVPRSARGQRSEESGARLSDEGTLEPARSGLPGCLAETRSAYCRARS